MSALESLHSHLIAHSDVKMKNILISDNNVAKLAGRIALGNIFSSLKKKCLCVPSASLALFLSERFKGHLCCLLHTIST